MNGKEKIRGKPTAAGRRCCRRRWCCVAGLLGDRTQGSEEGKKENNKKNEKTSLWKNMRL